VSSRGTRGTADIDAVLSSSARNDATAGGAEEAEMAAALGDDLEEDFAWTSATRRWELSKGRCSWRH
jgi:hypothetical protein